jgi:aminopeptidase N
LITVSQTQTVDEATPLFSTPVTIEFGFGRDKSERFDVTCDAADQTFCFTLAATPQTFAFDPNADVLKTLVLDVPVQMLITQLKNDDRVASRVDAANALAKDASAIAVAALSNALQRDKFWGVQAEAARALGNVRGDAAFSALVAATKVKHPKARRAVALALGEFRTDEACTVLERMLRKDASYFVEAAAATSIGKTKSARAHDVLSAALPAKESWQETVRAGVLAGMAELGDERSLLPCLAWTAYGKPTAARRAAVAALGKFGEGRKDVRDTLIALIEDRSFHVRVAAIDALEALHEQAAIGPFERIASQDVDGRLKRRCADAAAKIREHMAKPAEVKQLRDELAGVRDANRALQTRLEALEAKAPRAKRAGGKSRG